MENPAPLTCALPERVATVGEGIKDSLPIVISYLPVAFAFGLNATRLGFTPLESLFFSCIIYAGASQFVITAMLAAGSSLWVAALTVMAMDVRHVLYGPSLRSRIRSALDKKKTALWAFGLTDEVFAEALPGADAVFLCIPAGAMAEVLPHLVPHLDGRQILADITSVKMQPLGQMERAYAGPVVGTHPLFGPKPQPSDLRVCITPGAAATDTHIGLVEGLFKDMGCSTFRSTAEAHDSAAASIQGLNFISSLAYFATLAEHEELLPFITPSFRRRLEASRKLLTEDAPLFEWLFEANPMSQESIRQYRSFLNVAAGGDVNVLVQRAQWWWKEAR